jgi:hypothetical protein
MYRVRLNKSALNNEIDSVQRADLGFIPACCARGNNLPFKGKRLATIK